MILLIGTAMLSTRARRLLTAVLGRLLDVDVDAVFSDKRTADEDVKQELRRSMEVAILVGRGNELQRDTFDSLFQHRPASKPVHIRVLLPSTTVESGRFDWVAQRESELERFDPSQKGNNLLDTHHLLK